MDESASLHLSTVSFPVVWEKETQFGYSGSIIGQLEFRTERNELNGRGRTAEKLAFELQTTVTNV